jgi:hypothetical protein
MFFGGMTSVPGAPGNLLSGNPFGSDFVIPKQRKQQSPGPQLNPLLQTPARIFLPHEPGRGGAIPVNATSWQAMNMLGAPGNAAGMANASFFGGPQIGLPIGFGSKMVS